MHNLIKLYKQIIHHERLIETITTSIFYLRFKVDNENDMAAHAIFFFFIFVSTDSHSESGRTAQHTILPADQQPI